MRKGNKVEKIRSAILTGATGVLGTALLKKLVHEQAETYVVCNPESKRNGRIMKSPYIHLVSCDMREVEKLPGLIDKDCEAFFHFAWLGTADPNNRMNMHLQAQNIQYTLNTVEVAHKLGCRVYIGAGSQAEYGRIDGVIHSNTPENPISGYGMAKLCAGQMTRAMCREYGIRHIWPRVLSVYGPYDGENTLISTVVRSLLRGEKPSLTAGEQIWDYLYSGDAAEAFYRMALRGRDGAVYVLGSGKTKPLREFMGLIRNAINPVLPLGIGERQYYKDQAMHLEADIADLAEDTGWRPEVSFEEGIQSVIEYMRGQKPQ